MNLEYKISQTKNREDRAQEMYDERYGLVSCVPCPNISYQIEPKEASFVLDTRHSSTHSHLDRVHLDPEELAPARSLQQVQVGLHGGLASARREEVSEHQWKYIFYSYNVMDMTQRKRYKIHSQD